LVNILLTNYSNFCALCLFEGLEIAAFGGEEALGMLASALPLALDKEGAFSCDRLAFRFVGRFDFVVDGEAVATLAFVLPEHVVGN
jgi:hypothetical protein